MKIGINTRLSYEKQTGIQRYISGLVRGLKKVDKNHKYVLLGKRKMTNLTRVWFDLFGVDKKIVGQKIRVYHNPSTGMCFKKRKGCKYVVTVHDLGFKVVPSFGSFWYRLYFEFLTKWSLKKADVVIVDSKTIKHELVKLFKVSKRKVKVVYPGVDEFFKRKENRYFLKKVKKKYGKGKEIILVPGGHSGRKNVKGVVRMVEENPGFFDKYQVVVTGCLDKRYKEGSLAFFKYISKRDLRGLYQVSRLVICPSFYEGFGMPILESLASGCMVIGSKIKVYQEIMKDDEWLFDAKDTQNMFGMMMKALRLQESKKKKIVKKYLNRMERFSFIKMSKKMINIYENL